MTAHVMRQEETQGRHICQSHADKAAHAAETAVIHPFAR